MALMKLAAGLAVGYVLGTRAGQEKYEQIAVTARKVAAHPTAVQAQEKAKALISTSVDTVNTRLDTAAAEQATAPAVTTSPKPGPARRKSAPRPAATLSTADPAV
ncbi:hypothetical protein [Actinoplanes sp. DH11]|uniref:hypothetical protein n=1 Tax=Actinoplanes sp. DH11 TaxID=2857011 RepID=UPI001E6382EF|nr:hypothetical protein [Actinoplanes sp. DH11]